MVSISTSNPEGISYSDSEFDRNCDSIKEAVEFFIETLRSGILESGYGVDYDEATKAEARICISKLEAEDYEYCNMGDGYAEIYINLGV